MLLVWVPAGVLTGHLSLDTCGLLSVVPLLWIPLDGLLPVALAESLFLLALVGAGPLPCPVSPYGTGPPRCEWPPPASGHGPPESSIDTATAPPTATASTAQDRQVAYTEGGLGGYTSPQKAHMGTETHWSVKCT